MHTSALCLDKSSRISTQFVSPLSNDSAPVLAGLAVGIAFFLILTYSIAILSDRVVTTPVVRVDAALTAAKEDLEKQLPEMLSPYQLKEGEEELKDFGLLPANPNFEPLKLVFVHRNGTQFLINQTDHTIISSCNLDDQNLCYTGDRRSQDFIEGHLIYVMEVSGRVNETIEVGSRYMADAINGKALYPQE